MLKKGILFGIILTIFIISVLILVLVNARDLSDWINKQWIEIFYAITFAVIVGIAFELIYSRIKPKPKLSQKTVLAPKNFVAKLILPDNKVCLMKDEKRIFGREDFLGSLTTDTLMYIGHNHFKITKKDKDFYLKDLNSTNGTKLNGEEVEDHEFKLSDGDQISVADVLDFEFKVGK